MYYFSSFVCFESTQQCCSIHCSSDGNSLFSTSLPPQVPSLGSWTIGVAHSHTSNVRIYMHSKVYIIVMNELRGRSVFLISRSHRENQKIQSSLYVHSLQCVYSFCRAYHRSEHWLCVASQHRWSWNQDYRYQALKGTHRLRSGDLCYTKLLKGFGMKRI